MTRNVLIIAMSILFTSAGYAGVSLSANGYDGGMEQSGGDAGSISVTLAESNSQVAIQGTVDGQAVHEFLPSQGNKLYLYASGGDGGNGFDGQDGQAGYDGMPGRHGHPGRSGKDGRRGRDGTRHSPNGENGEDGTRGGRGGDGYAGESGGDGSNGTNGTSAGHGGDGGHIQVYSQDLSLFMLVNSRVYGGSGGVGGAAGEGGRAGYGGRGGEGGIGGPGGKGGRGGRGYSCSSTEIENGCTDGQKGRRGDDGSRGWSGSDGHSGRSGSRGQDGSRGTDGWGGSSGTVNLIHTDQNGNVVNRYGPGDLFKLTVQSFEVLDANQDGIFEPGETFTVKNITVANTGTMLAPASGQVEFSGFNVTRSSLESLPAINSQGSYTLKGTVTGQVSLDQSLGSRLVVSPSTFMRGLEFYASHAEQNLTVQYPLQITQVNSVEHVNFDKPNKYQVSVKNISSKKHSKISLAHRLEGSFTYKVLSSIDSISPGDTQVEVIEYVAEKGLQPYHTSKMQTKLYRGAKEYASLSNSWQVIPGFTVSPDSAGVIVFNHQTEANFQSLFETLMSSNLQLDVFDLRTNAVNLLKASDYVGKMVFVVPGNPLTTEQTTSLDELLATDVNVGAFKYPTHVEGPNYKSRRKYESSNYFQLDKPVESFISVAFDVMPFTQKLSSHKDYYVEDKAQLLEALEVAFIKTLKDEYKLARDKYSIYTKGKPLVMDYVNYTLALDPTDNFGYRAQALSLQPRIDDFVKGGRAGRKLRDDFMPEVEAAFKDLQKLGESCGEIKGTYKNQNGESWKFGYTFFRSVKGQNADKSIKLKGKQSDNNQWSLEYEFEDQDYTADIEMNCDEATSVIELNINLNHNQQLIQLIKVATK